MFAHRQQREQQQQRHQQPLRPTHGLFTAPAQPDRTSHQPDQQRADRTGHQVVAGALQQRRPQHLCAARSAGVGRPHAQARNRPQRRDARYQHPQPWEQALGMGRRNRGIH
ncbi:hypothetical protein D3C81_1454310 [compost metagenome]